MSPVAWFWRAWVTVVLVALTGCASVERAPGGSAGAGPVAASPVDPWENWNRKVFGFNDSVDKAVLKPLASAYRDIVPALVRKGITNVLGNIGDVWSAANHLLQGKFDTGLEMGFRVLTNTLIGLGGVLDPATEFGMTRRSEDFGQTLGRWGVGNGPFVVLPLLGPSTLRDTAGFLLDRQASPATLPPTSNGSAAVSALELLNTRANLLATTDLLDQVALDKYSFVRDAYLSRRRDALYDGAPPLDDNFGDDPAAPAAAPAAARPAAKPALAGPRPAPAAPAPTSPAPPASPASPAPPALPASPAPPATSPPR